MDGDEKVRVHSRRKIDGTFWVQVGPFYSPRPHGQAMQKITAALATPPESAQPVGEVDEAMVEAIGEAWDSGTWNGEFIGSVAAAKAALTAARLPAQGGGDAEDTVVARLDAAFKDGYAKGYAASSAEDKAPDCEDCAHNGRYLCDEHGPPAPTYCDIHQHYKWCDHNGGVLGKTGYEAPAAAEPSADAGRDGVDEDFVYLLTTHYETMRNGAISFTPNTHALHCMKAALIAAAPAHRQQGDDDER